MFFKCDQYEYDFPQDIVNNFRFRQANDTIVALADQQGGLTGINFPDVIHAGGTLLGWNAVVGCLNSSEMAERAYALLDGPTSGFENTFPGTPSSGDGIPTTVPGQGAAQDQQDYADQCAPGGPLKPAGAQLMVMKQSVKTLQTVSVPDDRVQIVTPSNGQVFAPGDTVNITVRLTPPLTANNVAVDLTGGFAQLDGTNYNGTQYEASFTIPEFFAGPMTLTPDITDTGNTPILGPSITIAVQSSVPPLSIDFVQKNFHLALGSAQTERLFLVGTYSGLAGNGERDITSSAAGTTYATTNPAVVTVNSEGRAQIVGPGVAVVTAANGGLDAFATFVVEDPTQPQTPEDISAQFTIQEGGYRLDRRTGFFVQSITITNAQDVPVPGPLYLLVEGLPSGINLVNASGISQNVSPGSPYVAIPLSVDGTNMRLAKALR
jgi:hypothetical protein